MLITCLATNLSSVLKAGIVLLTLMLKSVQLDLGTQQEGLSFSLTASLVLLAIIVSLVLDLILYSAQPIPTVLLELTHLSHVLAELTLLTTAHFGLLTWQLLMSQIASLTTLATTED